ncbi:MAG: hypothetical protein DRO13_00930 [Thermoprotei archaeon]|nr:MAG: hypothetical protein DRO13_00930 [Thermoprotei archaeon]
MKNSTYIVELVLEDHNNIFLEALKNSLYPDSQNVPKNCNVEIIKSGESLKIMIKCSEVNDLRALFNSFYSIVSAILHIREEVLR